MSKRLPFAVNLLIATAGSLASGALILWEFDAHWWSLTLAAASVPFCFWPLLRPDKESRRG